jgi:hypothetical protein
LKLKRFTIGMIGSRTTPSKFKTTTDWCWRRLRSSKIFFKIKKTGLPLLMSKTLDQNFLVNTNLALKAILSWKLRLTLITILWPLLELSWTLRLGSLMRQTLHIMRCWALLDAICMLLTSKLKKLQSFLQEIFTI